MFTSPWIFKALLYSHVTSKESDPGGCAGWISNSPLLLRRDHRSGLFMSAMEHSLAQCHSGPPMLSAPLSPALSLGDDRLDNRLKAFTSTPLGTHDAASRLPLCHYSKSNQSLKAQFLCWQGVGHLESSAMQGHPHHAHHEALPPTSLPGKEFLKLSGNWHLTYLTPRFHHTDGGNSIVLHCLSPQCLAP